MNTTKQDYRQLAAAGVTFHLLDAKGKRVPPPKPALSPMDRVLSMATMIRSLIAGSHSRWQTDDIEALMGQHEALVIAKALDLLAADGDVIMNQDGSFIVPDMVIRSKE